MDKMSEIESFIHQFNVLGYPKNWPYKLIGGFKDGEYHILMEKGIPIEDTEGEFDIDEPTRYEYETVFRVKAPTASECIEKFLKAKMNWEFKKYGIKF